MTFPAVIYQIVSKCILNKLISRNINSHLNLRKGVCLVEAESGRSTSKSMQLPNQSVSYGLFQVGQPTFLIKYILKRNFAD